MAITWRELIVSTSEGSSGETLTSMIRSCPANLDSAVISNGKIESWYQYFISAPGEDPDWDTPRAPVDWDGFEDALAAARQ